jgi:uncharacterized membrane protein YhiD involved in acid resistance
MAARKLLGSIAFRLIAYYGGLAAAGGMIWLVATPGFRVRLAQLWMPGMPTLQVVDALGSTPVAPNIIAPMQALFASLAACALALPVAWVYTYTRRAQGFSQSVAHALVLLPTVVAAITVLVKESLPLAFALAGIVAAVRFRNTLEDSKDAVFIFVATGIGIAAGVELSAAATLSFVFNLATLLLFLSDFGRTPARLEGEMAEDRMRRALSMANRTSQFVARIDREILEDMAPQQLEALAERAWKRKQKAEGDEGDEADEGKTLRVRTNNLNAARGTVEAMLTRDAKRWKLKAAVPENTGEVTLEYTVRFRKSIAPEAFLAAVRGEANAGVLGADLS